MRVADRLRAQNTFPKVGSYYMGCYHAGGDKEVRRGRERREGEGQGEEKERKEEGEER